MKSKPAAMLSLAALAPDDCLEALERWSNPEQTSFWECRYAAAMIREQLSPGVVPSVEEPHPFVQARLAQLTN